MTDGPSAGKGGAAESGKSVPARVPIPESGFVAVDKPVGVTSFDVVAALRGALGTRHVGHAGTLDPLASGLLLIGYGPATHLLPAIVGESKTYVASVRLGVSTSTDDAEGDFSWKVQPASVRERVRGLAMHPERIRSVVANRLTGTIEQVPSDYSAVKVHGEHAYDLARSGTDVHLEARTVIIEGFTISEPRLVDAREAEAGLSRSANPSNSADPEALFCDFEARVTCSAGTYIRSLARDLGRLLGVGGYLTGLRRVRIGRFGVGRACRIGTREKTYRTRDGGTHTRLAAWADASAIRSSVLGTADVAQGCMAWIPVTSRQARELSFGRPAFLEAGQTVRHPESVRADGPVAGLVAAITTTPARVIALVRPGTKRMATDDWIERKGGNGGTGTGTPRQVLVLRPHTVLVPQLKDDGAGGE